MAHRTVPLRMAALLGLLLISTISGGCTALDDVPTRHAAVVEIPVSLAPGSLGLAAWRLITGEGAAYELTGTMDTRTPFGPTSMPIRGAGQTLFRRPGG